MAHREPWKRALLEFEARLAAGLHERLPPQREREPPALSRHRAELAGLGQRLRTRVAARSIASPPSISFLILTRDQPVLLQACIASLERSCRVPYEILIGDTGSRSQESLDYLERTPHDVHFLGHYHFSSGINILAARSRGEYLVLVNDDVEQLELNAEAAIQCLEADSGVGCVGAMLLYPDRRIQHAGIRFCPTGPHRLLPEHIDRFADFESYDVFSAPREVFAVTGACMMLRAERFREIGGLDESYLEEAQDIDLCLRLREQGLVSLISNEWVAYHVEGATRTRKGCAEDRALFLDRYRDEIEARWLPEQAEKGEQRAYDAP